LPAYAAICGIPRSGTIIAAMLAEFRHVHLVEFADLQRGESPWQQPHRRRIPAQPADGKVLVVDDTCWTGRTMRDCRQQLAGRNVDFAALYWGDDGRRCLDQAGRRLSVYQHTFEWNMLRDCLSREMLFDLDGVIAEDWGRPDVGPEWLPKYERFLRDARPLYLPCYKILGIVTARLQKYRPQTQAWLARHGVRAKTVTMAPFDNVHAREQYGHARYKADVYARSEARLFVESSDVQAREIFDRTRRPAFSVDSLRMYGGIDPDPWP
jgi:orotate phosphoribosyltransferase